MRVDSRVASWLLRDGIRNDKNIHGSLYFCKYDKLDNVGQ